MKGNKLFATAFWVIVVAALSGLLNYVLNAVDMYYSTLAPQQVENDNVYGLMKFHGTVENILWIVYILVVILVIRHILKIWSKKEPENVTQ